MKKILILIAIVCVNISISQVSGQLKKIDPATEFNAKLKEQSKKITTIKCNFIQTKHATSLANDVKMRGVFYYNSGGRMCLDYSDPKGNQIVINGDKFAIQTAGKRNIVTAASNPMLRQLSAMLTACMTGDVTMFNSGWSSQYFEDLNEYVVELVPKDKRAKKYVTKIVLNFNKKDMSLNKMMMIESSGDYSQYEFQDKIFNGLIAEGVFKI